MNEAQSTSNTKTMTPLSPPADFTDLAIKQWAEKQAQEYKLIYLLAHCEDGIVWGAFETGALLTSADIAKECPQSKLPPLKPPPFAQLRPATLWMARIFGATCEVRLWKQAREWRAVLVRDVPDSDDCFAEQQFIWGTNVQAHHQGWSLMSDGRQGFYQWVPKLVTCKAKDEPYAPIERPLRLKIHHNINYDDHGRAYISYSRLVDIYANGE